MNKRTTIYLLLLVAFLWAGAWATQETITVKFKSGTSSASYEGSITDAGVKTRGEQHDRYLLGAAAGQVMKVQLRSDTPTYVYIWKDDFNRGFILDAEGTNIETRFKLPSKGDYNIDIVRPHSQDRHYKVTFTIN